LIDHRLYFLLTSNSPFVVCYVLSDHSLGCVIAFVNDVLNHWCPQCHRCNCFRHW